MISTNSMMFGINYDKFLYLDCIPYNDTPDEKLNEIKNTRGKANKYRIYRRKIELLFEARLEEIFNIQNANWKIFYTCNNKMEIENVLKSTIEKEIKERKYIVLNKHETRKI